MKRIALLLTLLLTCSVGLAYGQGGTISVDHIDGLIFDGGADKIGVGMPITYHLRFTNATGGYVAGMTNGLSVFSLDGAQFTPIVMTQVYDMSTMFDMVNVMNPFSVDGIGADTIGIGLSVMSLPGAPDGFDEICYIIETGVNDLAYVGMHLCIDSAYYPPSGTWLWAPGGVPAWSGQQCFEIYEIPNLPPEFVNPQMSYTGSHCDVAVVDFEATDPETDPADYITWSVESGIGAVVGADRDGQWSYAPSLGDVGASLNTVLGINDGFNTTVTHTMNLTFTNIGPAFTSGCGTLVPVGMGNTGVITLTGADGDCDPVTMSVTTVAPTPVGLWSFVGGVLTFDTDSPADGNILYTFTIEITDGVEATTCEVYFDVLSTEPYEVKIEKVHAAIQGMHHMVDVTIEKGSEKMGGFDILIAYDASALNFTTALEGDIYTCGWEYFNYRYGANGNCGNACPSGLLRVVGIAETNNGPVHPDFECAAALVQPYTLFTLDFLVTDDRTFECMYVPIRFFWGDCADNSIAYHPVDDPMSAVQGVSRYVIDFDLIGHIEDMYTGFPTYTGVQAECLVGGGDDKPAPIQFVDFINGGIDIVCADSIDARGDINLNGNMYEIADAVLFSNYFSHGLRVFTVNVAGQIAATDVNADGLTLSVGDLVYLIRVIVGDALPYPKLGVVEASYTFEDGIISVDSKMGAAAIVVAGNATPTLLAENMEMAYAFDGANTRILVSSMEIGAAFEGEFLRVNGQVLSIEMATYEGAPVAAKSVPSTASLFQNYPNPFNPTTTISFALPHAGDYTLTIYNVTGQTVANFSDQAEAGQVSVDWDASDMASGIYFYKLDATNFSDTKKMVLLK